MIWALSLNVLVGFMAHKLRPFTLQFERRLSDLLRYAIGLVLFVPLATLVISIDCKRHVMNGKRSTDKGFTERVFVDLLVTATSFGGGVAFGFITDKDID